MNLITPNQLKSFFKETFFAGLFLSLPVYAWVRVLLFEDPFSLRGDTSVLIKTIGTAWLIMMIIRLTWYIIVVIGENVSRLNLHTLFEMRWALKLFAVILLATLLYACNGQTSGISKDLNTGLITSYNGLSTTQSKIIMNGEVLNHTDIPIGESFIIANENVKGLTVKNNRVSVGCSLRITDKNGKTLLSSPDLFKDNDVFEKDKVDYLKCTVNTGKPMKWEEVYDVSVVFTDKYGKGKIENNVKIRMIDIP